MPTVGSGQFTYEMIDNWGALPTGWTLPQNTAQIIRVLV